MDIPGLSDWFSGIIRPRKLYLAGGTVRDILMGRTPGDFDIVCRNAKGFAKALAESKGAAFVAMEKKPDEPCYRVIDRADPGRYMDITELRGEDIEDDLRRRDFTINAAAIDLSEGGRAGEVIDPLGGRKDIGARTIRLAYEDAFRSDPLRILRAVRLSAALGFGIDDAALKLMERDSSLLSSVPAERTMAELMLVLGTKRGSVEFRRMDDLGILGVIFPEMLPAKGCGQGDYHDRDVWGHSLLALENCEKILNAAEDYFGTYAKEICGHLSEGRRFELLKLSAFLHDIGKPQTRRDETHSGRITFPGHDAEGGRAALSVAARLRMSKESGAFLGLMVEKHLFILHLLAEPPTSGPWLRLACDMGDDIVPLVILGISDIQASIGPGSGRDWRDERTKTLKNFVPLYYSVIRPRLRLPDLLTGDDLLGLGLEPGPEIGRIIREVRTAQDKGEINAKDEAITLALSLIKGRS